jgi:general secretion pathway protein G
MIRIIREYLSRGPKAAPPPRPIVGGSEPSEGSEAQKTRGKRRRSGGFSLLEIMIVLALIGMITAGVAVVINKSFQNAKIKIAKERIKEISQGVTTYMIDSNSTCPKSMDDLVAQKYVSKSSAKDPWGKDFVLRCPGQQDPDGADVTSSGPDKADGTADDIKSWEMQ